MELHVEYFQVVFFFVYLLCLICKCVCVNVCVCLCGFADSMDGCSTDCNGNGECVAGHCHCFAGFLGPDCAKGKTYLIKALLYIFPISEKLHESTKTNSLLGRVGRSESTDRHTVSLSPEPIRFYCHFFLNYSIFTFYFYFFQKGSIIY